MGQHFLTDPVILERLVSLADVRPGQTVLEVGSGPGSLTRTLLAHGCQVVAVEIDGAAVEFLRRQLQADQLQVIQGDLLELDLNSILEEGMKVVANLPYNAATEIFFRLENRNEIKEMFLMFQREVARRFVSRPDSKEFGPLSLLSRIRWDAEIVLELPGGAFTPRPKVVSSAVRFRRLIKPRVPEHREALVRTLVRTAFQQRRKQIRNALGSLVNLDQLQKAGIDPSLRPENVDLAGYARLAETMES